MTSLVWRLYLLTRSDCERTYIMLRLTRKSYPGKPELFQNKYNCYFLKDFIYLLLGRRGGREKERERNIDVQEVYRSVASRTPPTEHLAHNPGMCPDWVWSGRSFCLQANTQSTEPHQPGQIQRLFKF